ncbi:hypothetical protein CAP35_00055 [Chitinophagaceae bacterium IBVUCB1]|nr:hypothetical protein CAP35_00055 [Chitinophagaceae bacterium IBVUCB1]
MRNIYKSLGILSVMLASLLFAGRTYAQIPACSTYVFTTSSETYSYLSGGTSSSILCDDCIQTNIPLNFTFPFCGNNYTTVSVGSNGYLSLSNSSSVWLGVSASAITSTQPVLFPMWGDEWGTAGSASYSTTGTAPNRVFTFEWRNWRPYAQQSNSEYSMQVRLYETSGRIQFIYKREGTTTRVSSYGIGIAWSSSDYQSLPTPSVSPVPSFTTLFTYTAYPANNQVYQWDPPTPCPKATALTVGNVNSQAASFSWTGVTGALDYQYAVDTRADLAPNVATTIFTTPNTNGSITGLLPNTTYYAHIRTRCSLTSISQWDTVSFRTRAECTRPGKLIIANIDSNSCTFQWPAVTTANNYQYIWSATKLTPTGSAATTLATTSVALTGLMEGTRYYVYYRSLCPNIDSSAWMLDSFRTPVPCRAPILGLSWLTNNNAIVYWNSMNTAYQYEYFLGTPSNPPSIGTPIITTRIQTPYLQPSTDYAMYIRCNCNDFGVESKSRWAEIDFKTLPPTSISAITTASSRISLYPNPVADKLNVEIAGTYSNDAELEITDITGKVIIAVKVTSSVLQVDVTKLSSGIYMVRMKDDGTVSAVKFNKN